MNYNEFKKAKNFSQKKENEELLSSIVNCEDMLGVIDWLKTNENKDADGKTRYKATVTVNIHGRGEDDSNERGVRSLSYDTNFDFVEKKVSGEYQRLLKEFEDRTNN